MSLFAIGDLHGALDPLEAIFDYQEFQPEDTIVFIGDYVDKGPNVKGTIDWLLAHDKKYNFVFLQGNHELMMLDARESRENFENWFPSGGSQTLASYGIGDEANWAAKIGQAHWDFISGGQIYYEHGKYIFIHANIEPGIPLEKQRKEILQWTKLVDPKPYADDKVVIVGHTAQKDGEIANYGHTICIDTHAYGGGWLTCLNVETGEYIKANFQKEVRTGTL